MRRLFWLALGAAAGVYVARKVTRTAEALTPQSIATSLADSLVILGEGLRDFAVEVRAGMAERQVELERALGIEPGGPAPGER